MIEASLDPSSLPNGLINTQILETYDMSLRVIPFVLVKLCYNTTVFSWLGYALVINLGFVSLNIVMLATHPLQSFDHLLLLFLLVVLHLWMLIFD